MKVLPSEYIERMKSLLGDEFNEYVDSLNNSPVRAFRVNTEKISCLDFQNINVFSKNRIPYVENGFYFEFDIAPIDL